MTAAPPATRARSDHDVFGLPIDHLTSSQVVGEIGAVIAGGRRARVLNVNAHCINLARTQPAVRAALLAADVLHCDGSGVRLAARILGVPPPPRTSYSELMPELLAEASARGWGVFLLGSTREVSEQAARRLHTDHPGLAVDHHHGFFDKNRASAETGAVVDAVNASGARILVLGLGMPTQELWLHENWQRLEVQVGLAGGAVIDRLAGRARDAPEWVARLGLEWLVRLAREPRRLAKRYLVGLPRFLAATVVLRMRRGWWRIWGRRRGDRRLAKVA